ncbi:unnamed protein product [Malus baccata var. baccata]
MNVTSVTQTVPKIPVVDFSQEDCLKPGTSSWLSVRGNVCRALEFGCFMAVLPNKVSPELHDSMFGTLKELFDFPIETKAQTPQEQPLIDGHVTGPFHESLATGTDSEKSRIFEHHFWPNGNEAVWSNDRTPSCKHRVNLKENEERYSFGLFSYLKGVTRAPDELTTDDHPVKYKPLHMLDYVQFYMANYLNIGDGFSVKEYCGV